MPRIPVPPEEVNTPDPHDDPYEYDDEPSNIPADYEDGNNDDPAVIAAPPEITTALELVLDEMYEARDAWGFINEIDAREVPLADRQGFYQLAIAMIAECSPAERDALVGRMVSVFRCRAETARKDIDALIQAGITQTKIVTSVIGPNFIAEMVQTPSGAKFLVFKDDDSTTEIQDMIAMDDINHIVPSVASLGQALALPTGVADYVSETQLRQDIKNFITEFVRLDEADATLAAEYVKYTWIADRIPIAPYLHGIGDFGSGKSRLLDVLGGIVRRGLIAAGSLTGAVLFRALDVAKVTLIVDEVDFDKNDPQWKDILRILLVGSQQGRPILRTNMDAKGIIQSFDPFGPKILATRKPFSDPALNSRCLDFTMKPGTPLGGMTLILTDDFHAKAAVLRNKLLRWRFDHVRDITVDGFTRYRGLSPRVTQIAIAILAACEDHTVAQQIIDRLRAKSEDIDDSRSESFEGRVATALLKLRRDGRAVPLQDIADALNLGRPEKDHVSSQTIGEMVVGVFRLTKRRHGIGKVVVMTDKQAEELRALYGVEQRRSARVDRAPV